MSNSKAETEKEKDELDLHGRGAHSSILGMQEGGRKRRQ